MRTFRAAVCLLAALVAVSASGAVAPAMGAVHGDGPGRRSTQDRWIVVLRDSVPSGAEVAGEHRRRHGADVSHVYESALKGYAARIQPARIGEVRSDPRVLSVHEDRTVRAVGARVILASGESVPTGVRRVEAATTTEAHHAVPSRVAVIDTGIDLTHPDLPSAVDGVNCVVPGTPAQDDNGHGTHVAGTISAANQTGTGQGSLAGENLVGVTPGTTVTAVKVLSAAGTGLWSHVICGVDWVTRTRTDADPSNDVHVANMSLGGDAPSKGDCSDRNDALHRAICGSTSAGVTYVVAAGNEGADFAGSVPARYPEVLTVTAMSDSDGAPGATGGTPRCRSGEQDDEYARFSNYAVATSEQNHAIAGPGVCIRSTWPGGLYVTISGTSMAAPHVAGIVALCLASACAGKSPGQVIQQVRTDAKNHATSANGFLGDPLRPVRSGGKKKSATLYYGYLAWAGAY
jgi:subtilisin